MTDFEGNELGGAGWFLWMWGGALLLVGLLNLLFGKKKR